MTKNKNKSILALAFLLLLALISITVFAFSGTNVQSAYASSVNSSVTRGERAAAATRTFVLSDNTGYNFTHARATSAHPILNGNIATITVDPMLQGGTVDRGTHNGFNSFGLISGHEEVAEGNVVEIKLAFNQLSMTGIRGRDNWTYNISDDTWKQPVAGHQVGVVRHGALIVQRSTDGRNWGWQNNFTGGTTQTLQTTNFMETFSMNRFNGTEVRDAGGNITSDGRLVIYVPSGEDLQRGVFLRFILAYELRGTRQVSYWNNGFLGIGRGWRTRTETVFRNIVELTEFHLANGSGEVLFTNAFVDEGLPPSPPGDIDDSGVITEAAESGEERMFGTIKDGHSTNVGFRLNTFGNDTYDITYRFSSVARPTPSAPRVAVDGQFFAEPGRYDFRVRTRAGNTRNTTIFINERGINQNIETYFGGSLFSDDSRRVFNTSDPIPMFVAGYTWFETRAVTTATIPLSGFIRRADTDEVVATINGHFDSNNVFHGGDSRARARGLLSEPGTYIAEFSNNPDFFNGQLSGDAFHFVFRFILIEPELALGPMVNEELLRNNFGFSDFAAGHYAVTVPSQGAGNIHFAFTNFQSAFDLSYEYQRSLAVSLGNDRWLFNGRTYNSQFDVLGSITDAASAAVSKRHFDASNPDTYLTIRGAIDNIITQSFARDVTVFSDVFAAENSAVGEPFLNDRLFAYLNDDGTITTGRNPVRFISVADFESSSVMLTHIQEDGTNGRSFNIGFGVGVESFLQMQNALSGHYRITERNRFGDENVYYAIYIRPGDMRTTLTVDRFANNTLVPMSLSGANHNQSFNAQGFVIRNAANDLDPFGIIRIDRVGDPEFRRIYQLNEVDDIIVDENGSYIVTAVDRLGNSASFRFEIINAISASRVTLVNQGEVLEQFVLFSGQSRVLPTPSPHNTTHEFVGWQRGNVRHVNQFVSDGVSEVSLVAQWNYKQTTVEFFDGTRISSVTSRPEQTVALPQGVTKQGFALFGWQWTDSNGFTTFYPAQITSVPNVANMRLDAVWRRNFGVIMPEQGSGNQIQVTLVDGIVVNTLNGTHSGELALPVLESQGLIFAGWLWEVEPGRGGYIFDDSILELPNLNGITLFALWLTCPNASGVSGAGNESNEGGGGVAARTTGGGIGAFLSSLFTGRNIAIMLPSLALLILLLVLVKFLRKNKQKAGVIANAKKTSELEPVFALEPSMPKLALAVCSATSANPISAQNASSQSLKPVKPKPKRLLFFSRLGGGGGDVDITPRRGHWKWILPVVSILLVFVMCFMAMQESLINLRNAQLVSQARAYQERIIDDLNADIMSFIEESERRNEFLAATSAVFNDINTESTSEFISSSLGLSDEEIFLLSLVYFDLMEIGYYVFEAKVMIPSVGTIYGLAFTDFEDLFRSENSDRIYFGSGFVSVFGSPEIPAFEVDKGLEIISLDEQLISNDSAYLLTFEENYGTSHFVAFEQYFVYHISGTSIHYEVFPATQDYFDLSIGFLFDYDLGRAIFDPDLGTSFNAHGFSLTESLDYDFVLETFRAFIQEQEANGLSVETVTSTFISIQAINDFIASNFQDESFLGIPPDELMAIESQLDDTHFYIVLPNGEIDILEFPPDPPPRASLFQRIAMAIASVAMVVVGVVITVATAGAAAPLAGALTGAAVEMFMQVTVNGTPMSDINWLRVGVAAVGGAMAAIPGIGWVGAGLVVGGTQAAMTLIEGGTLTDALISFGIGFATGALIHFGTKALGNLSRKVTNRLGKCFVAGTGVLVSYAGIQQVRAIEDIRAGDRVYTFNELLGVTQVNEVKQVFRSVHTELVHVTTGDGNTISSSIDHPYFVVSRGGLWIEAQHLRAGDVLRTVNGRRVVVEQVQHEILESPQRLYNFEVIGNHNYFVSSSVDVATDEFVLVHNACVGGNVVGNGGQSVQSAKQAKMKAVREAGARGESRANIVQTKPRASFRTPSGKIRYPDAITGTEIIEVKNRAKQGLTRQLKDNIAEAARTGKTPVLVVDGNTTLSRPLLEAQRNFEIFIRRMPLR